VESILARFDVTVISRYFSEIELELPGYLSQTTALFERTSRHHDLIGSDRDTLLGDNNRRQVPGVTASLTKIGLRENFAPEVLLASFRLRLCGAVFFVLG
jgi:hypothetical protein